VIAFGVDLCFASIYFIFFSPRDLQASLADYRKMLHDDGKCVRLNNTAPKFCGLSPKKFWGQKHAKFGSILDDFKL